MKDPSLHAVDMVRRIRDAQARALARKSPAEVIAYYRAAGVAATARVVQRQAVSVRAGTATRSTSPDRQPGRSKMSSRAARDL